jgi:hypothetical protein
MNLYTEVPRKRMKLESSPTPSLETADETPGPSQGINKKAGSATSGGDHCSICLHAIVDRTVIPTCAHEFCFECVLVWSGASFFFLFKTNSAISI